MRKQGNLIKWMGNMFLLSIVLASGTLFNIAFSNIVTSVMIGSVIILAIYGRAFSISLKSLIAVTLVFLFLISQSLFIDMQTLEPNIKIAIKFAFIVIGISILLGRNVDIFENIAKILFFFANLSFVVYVLMLLEVPLPSQSIPGQNYQGILYLNVRNIALGLAGSGITIPRNFGIYWEPGLYQVYLNFLVIYFLYIKKNVPAILFLCINVILTFSPTGYITTLIIIALYVVGNKEGSIKKIIIVLIGGVAIIIAYPWFENFMQFKSTTNSFEWRFHDINYGIETFLRNPIFGIGTSQEEYKTSFYSVYGIMHGNTNGLVSIAMEFGLIGIIYYSYNLYWFYRFWSVKYSISCGIATIAWMVCALINEPIEISEMLMAFIAIGLSTSTVILNRHNIAYNE